MNSRPRIARLFLAALSAAVLLGHSHGAAAQVSTQATKPATEQANSANAKAPVSTAARWTDRAYLGINGMYQGGSKGFSEAFSFDQYAESAHVTTTYPASNGPTFDMAGGFRVWRNMAAGVAVSRFSKSGTAGVQASVPNPLYLAQDRQISGSFASGRTETAIHVQAAWVIPAGKRILLTMAGGPSFFSVTQSLVNGVRWSQTYPYDSADFAGADVQESKKSALGLNAGADMAYFFSRTVGVGGFARYAAAPVQLGGKSGSINVDAGGFQAGVGLRIRIPAGATAKQPAKPAGATPPKR